MVHVCIYTNFALYVYRLSVVPIYCLHYVLINGIIQTHVKNMPGLFAM